MAKAPLKCLCHNFTTFTKTGEFDNDAYRKSIQRSVDVGIGVSCASGGGGEGHLLTHEDLSRVYSTAVAVGKGKISVESNQPSQPTARLAIEHARIAIDAGIDVVSIYGPSQMHGYRVTDPEYELFFDRVLTAIDHPVMLNPNPLLAYASPAAVSRICDKYPHVVSIAIAGHPNGDAYFIELVAALNRDVEIYVPIAGSINMFGLGAAGMMIGTSNLMPKTVRQYLDLCDAGRFDEAAVPYFHMRRFDEFVRPWLSAYPRVYKMAMKILKLPGWEGGMREPYIAADDAELERFQAGLLELGIPEINELARAAGVEVPAAA